MSTTTVAHHAHAMSDELDPKQIDPTLDNSRTYQETRGLLLPNDTIAFLDAPVGIGLTDDTAPAREIAS